MVEGGGGQRTHQPDRTAAINETDSIPGEKAAEVSCGGGESGVAARSRSAIDANRLQFGHGAVWHPIRARVKAPSPTLMPPLWFTGFPATRGAEQAKTLYMTLDSAGPP
jgi:hypothetical protein